MVAFLASWGTLFPISLVEALNNTPQNGVDELLKYDSVKSHLTMQIVSTEYNANKLVDVPHQEIQDMSIVYRIDLGETIRGGGISTLVANSLMKAFKVTTDQLHQDALEMHRSFIHWRLRPCVPICPRTFSLTI